MKNLLYLIYILCVSLSVYAGKAGTAMILSQASSAPYENLSSFDSLPRFSGGSQALYRYIESHIVYPEQAKKDWIEGEVFVRFLIGDNGSISHVKVIEGIRKDLDDEAVRLVSSFTGWKPGEIKGKKVPSYMAVAIPFVLKEFPPVGKGNSWEHPSVNITDFVKEHFFYPEEAIKQELIGCVEVTFTIDETGKVLEIPVLHPVDPVLDSLVVNKLQQMPWIPRYVNGKPQLGAGKAYQVIFDLRRDTIEGKEKISPVIVMKKVMHIGTPSKPLKMALPLWVVDNKPVGFSNGLKDIKPDEIDSLNVLKGDDALRKYGWKGSIGVVEVFTKKRVPK